MPRSSVSEQLRKIIAGDLRSQADIARGAGVAPASLSRFMRKERGLCDSNLDKLCKYLKLELRRIETTGK